MDTLICVQKLSIACQGCARMCTEMGTKSQLFPERLPAKLVFIETGVKSLATDYFRMRCG